MAARTSNYQQSKTKQTRSNNTIKQQKFCAGCDSLSHGSGSRSTKCPAWRKRYQNCNTLNHIAHVCRKKTEESVGALIVHVKFDKQKQQFTTASDKSITDILAQLTPYTSCNKYSNPSATLHAFPDSGASICLAGPQHLEKLRVSLDELIPCFKRVTAVGGFQLICHGLLPVQFQIRTYSTKQPLYMCNKVDHIYVSRKGCLGTNIIPTSFPFPMNTTDRSASITSAEPVEDQQSPSLQSPPPRPDHLPFSATIENITKLEQFIWDQFASSAFNKSTPVPSMSTPPAHIHLKLDVKPYARHSPIPVPYNWKAEVKASLDRDIGRGIIKPVPIGTPVEWCSIMVIIQKNNGSPCRTVDLQR